MSDASLISAVVIAIVAFVYLTIIRPARQEQERHRQQLRDLRPGDQVLTTSNFIATVKEITIDAAGQSRIALELADGVVVTALPGAILRRLEAGRQKAAPAGEPPTQAPTGSEQMGHGQART